MSLAKRISYLMRRRVFDHELEEEMQFHIETRADELECSGVDRHEALMQARREFGSSSRAQEETRDAWQIAWLEDLTRDLRYCGRTLARSPGFAAVAILSLALGIGANTTVFSIVKAVLLSSLPVREPEQLVSFHQGNGVARLSYPDFADYQGQVSAFEGVAATYPAVPRSLGGSNPERLWGQLVTTNYFSVLGAEPRQGRGFSGGENESTLVVISDSLWRRRFGSEAGIIGKTILLGERSFAVVGVAPPGFNGNLRGLKTDFWIPLGLYAQTVPQLSQGAHGPLERNRNYPWLFLTARRKSGVSLSSAQAALQIVADRLDRTYPKAHGQRKPQLAPADALAVAPDQAKSLLSVLMAVVGLVLLVACANVANLLLARASARKHEIGVRLAIGAGRARLVRQLLTETVCLSVMGATVGLAFAWAATSTISKFQSALPYPVALDFGLDWRVLLFTASLAIVTGIVFGLLPALRSTNELTPWLRAEAGGFQMPRRFGLKNCLLVVQVSVSLVLLVAAGLFLQSLRVASAVPLGMQTSNVLLLSFDPRAAGYSNERAQLLFGQLLERVRALPNVESAGLVDTMPLSFVPNAAGVSRPGADKPLIADIYGASSEYFRTLGIRLTRGEDFDAWRTTAHPPAVINEALASRLFRADDPIGKVVDWEGMSHQVIAVAQNAKSRTTTESTRPQIYVSLEREYGYFWGLSGVVLTVKAAGPSAGLVDSIRGQMRDLAPALPVYNVQSMNDHVGRALLIPRLCGALFGIFGLIALLLAVVGLYGVMSYSVRQRTQEIGIRLAIGARPMDVLWMLARQGFWLTCIGLGIGLGVAYSVSRVASAFLYGVSARDSATFAAVSVLLFAVAMAAVLVPARRAAGMDALRSIRYE